MAADDLTQLGSAVRWEMTGIADEWAGMRPWYEAPERDRLLALMDAPTDDARRLEEQLRAGARLLVTYAGELAGIQRTLADLEWRASAFRERVRHGVMVPVSESGRPTLLQTVVGLVGGVEPEVLVHWRESAEAVAENEALLAEYWQILERLTTAADEVENGIRALLTDAALVADTHPVPAESYDAPYLEMPWGWPATEEMNVVEDITEGGRRIWDGLLAFLPLLGIDPVTGALSAGTAAQSWLGVGNLLGSVMVAAAYPEARMERWGLAQLPWLQDRYRTAGSVGLMVGYDAAAAEVGESAWHGWRDNPWATGMDAGFTVLSAVAPGAGAARFAAMSARTARWARITGLGADFLVPGGSFAVAGAARLTGNLADLARFGDHLPGVAVRQAGAADAFTHTPASDHFFGSTTAERSGGVGTVDEAAGSGEGPAGSDAWEPVTEPDLDGAPPQQPPNDPPGTGGGDGSPGDGAGDDPADGDDAPPVRPELLSPWHPGVVSSVEPLYPDLEWAQTYGSGDVHLPGWDPPRTPADTFTPGSGGHGWYAEIRQVTKPSFEYQMQVSGLLPDAGGRLPEYYRTTPDGREVSYDGMVMRGDVAVHQEMKNGWDDLAFLPDSPHAIAKLDDWIEQARRQVAGLPPGGVLEWHLSNAHAAAAIREAFAKPDLGLVDVVVLYTPRL